MQSRQNTRVSNYTYTLPPEEGEMESQEISDMATSMMAVESLLRYRFKDRKLLEDALTHPSCTNSTSYQRLEFVGDAALGLAISNFVFLSYPQGDPGKLSLVRAANVSTENLARVAVRHQLYNYVRHNATGLDEKVKEFVIAVQREGETEVYGGLVKAPKVLADIVESLAAAVYVDCNFDLKAMWVIFRHLLDPIVMLDYLEQQPQPVTMLFEVCQKEGKEVEIKYGRQGEKNNASIFVDGHLVASASSENKENAKLNAAKAALDKLPYASNDMATLFSHLDEDKEVVGAKQKLHDLCGKKKWSTPIYKIHEETGSAHRKRFICSVEIEITEGVLFVTGNEKLRVREAESSAASKMLYGLKDSNYI